MIEASSGAASTAAVYSDSNGLARLRRDAQAPSPETVRKVAQQFEALFIQMMLKNMRETGVGDELFGSDQEKLYRDMFDQQLSVDLSEKGALGLADLLVRQLTRSPGADGAATTAAAAPATQAGAIPLSSPSSPPRAAIATPPEKAPEKETAVSGEPAIGSPEDFVRVLAPHAEDAARELGVSPRVLLAQAALETGWGRSVMRTPDGGSSHNLFGIKADARWSGDRVVSETLEYEGGVAVKRRETFRAYASYADSFADYAAFLRDSPRYGAALSEGANGAAFLQRLQQAGYATDPEYANKISRIAFGAESLLAQGAFKDASVMPLTDSDEVTL
ncbi:MAG: flagellar assembly peptidoglycan hydrolase FlgJ [Gammaproteobacteria bacterium]|nr:flagellar assembly peptidoglycan hydrolase FlgJ [Gammaproteobacteria bacterium]